VEKVIRFKKEVIRKHSLRPLPKLKAKAEKLFHKYICKRDNYICFTCGEGGNQAGHFWHNKLDFDERNLHCQCAGCNKWRHGNLAIYATKLVYLHGENWFEELSADAHREKSKKSRQELEELIKKYSSV